MHKLICQAQNYAWGKKGKNSYVGKILEKNGRENNFSHKITKKIFYYCNKNQFYMKSLK